MGKRGENAIPKIDDYSAYLNIPLYKDDKESKKCKYLYKIQFSLLHWQRFFFKFFI